jgi:exopolysaccharide biosynthesis predicted pyruvyltransferase EpsI
MRIGILTYHCHSNFGAQLQAISSVGYFKRMGHEPIVLHWYPKDLEEMLSKRIPDEQTDCHKVFTENNLPISNICRTTKELADEIERLCLDALFVGSDALFKYTPLKCRKRFSIRKLRFVDLTPLSCQDLLDNPFFGKIGGFLSRKIPMVAFSVSSQNCPYTKMTNKEVSEMSKQMDNFLSISVRDEWTKSMVETINKRNSIQITPDPVFSFNQNCYITIPSKEEIMRRYDLRDNYILMSFSDWYNKKNYIKSIALEFEKVGYQTVGLPMPEKLFAPGISKKIDLPLNPIDWYALIKYSSGYVGERMHPIIVAIHNNIPFVVFDEYGVIDRYLGGIVKLHHLQSSKTYLILKRAGLEEQLYSYFEHKKKPSPNKVVSLLQSFDRERCSEFSLLYQKEYEKAMKRVLEIFNKNSNL